MNQQVNASRQAAGLAGGHDVPAGGRRSSTAGATATHTSELPAEERPKLPGDGRNDQDLLRTWDDEGSITARVHLSRTARQHLVRAWRLARARETRPDAGDESQETLPRGASDRLIA